MFRPRFEVMQRLGHLRNGNLAVLRNQRLLVLQLGLGLEGAVVDRAGVAAHGRDFSACRFGRMPDRIVRCLSSYAPEYGRTVIAAIG